MRKFSWELEPWLASKEARGMFAKLQALNPQWFLESSRNELRLTASIEVEIRGVPVQNVAEREWYKNPNEAMVGFYKGLVDDAADIDAVVVVNKGESRCMEYKYDPDTDSFALHYPRASLDCGAYFG